MHRPMGRAYLIAMLVLGAFASVLGGGSPKTDSTAPKDGSSSVYLGEAVSETGANDFSDMQSGQGITLDRSGDGHFYADVEVNGQSIRFLVDTGASTVALSRDDARRAGLAASIAMPNVVGEGASGAVHGEVVILERVSLGSASAVEMPAVVLDSGSQSLLGQSFLSKFGSVEISGDRMVLR